MITSAPDVELYLRGAETLIASWAALARGSEDAALVRAPGVSVAVFPSGPERGVYNNALLERGLDRGSRRHAIDAMEATYASAGVDRYAAWVHETDQAMVELLAARGYVFDMSTRAMGMDLAALRVRRPELELTTRAWSDHLAHLACVGLPDGLLAGVDPVAFHAMNVELDGRLAATGVAFDLDGDCGIYNVSTLPDVRRRGLGTAITAELAYAARERGCTTASLQSTQMAESLYARIGFRDLGRFLEYVPTLRHHRAVASA